MLTKQECRNEKDKLVGLVEKIAIAHHLTGEQTTELVKLICSSAVQYGMNIGEDTEISAMEVLHDEIEERISFESIEADSYLISNLFGISMRYAQIDVLEEKEV